MSNTVRSAVGGTQKKVLERRTKPFSISDPYWAMLESMNDPKNAETIDYSHELKLTKNPLLRYVWMGLGFLFTGLGFLGYVLPGLPGTVFILMAVYFFARSSPRFYNWLLNNPVFGGLIRDWRAGLGLPLRAKILAITTICLTTGFSAYIISVWPVKILVLLCGVGVSIFLITRPTKVA